MLFGGHFCATVGCEDVLAVVVVLWGCAVSVLCLEVVWQEVPRPQLKKYYLIVLRKYSAAIEKILFNLMF